MEETLAGIYNVLAYSERLLTAGQPTAEELKAVRDAGYEVVINLLPEFAPKALMGEREQVRDLGMEYIAIPVDWSSPTERDLAQFFAAMARLEGRKLFVHCAANMRVSAFVFLWRTLVLNVPEDEAEDTMETIWEPNGTWRAFLNERLRAAGRF